MENIRPSSQEVSDHIIYEERNDITYRKGRFLGEGGFAKCYEVCNIKTGALYAAKIVAKSSLQKSRAKLKLLTEIKVHMQLSHNHIVKFIKSFEFKDNVYILLELCSNKTMMDMLKKRKRLTEPETQYYMFQLLSAIEYMHSQNVIHRDLKLGNLFLSDGMNIKIGDFGLATVILHDGERKRTICGTPNYIAPEVLDNTLGHSFEVDIWSLGVILYTLLIGSPPFQTKEVTLTYQKIKDTEYAFPPGIAISPHAQDLIRRLLRKEPLDRPTLQDIFQHPFLCGVRLPRTLPDSALYDPPVNLVFRDAPQRPPSNPHTTLSSATRPPPLRTITESGDIHFNYDSRSTETATLPSSGRHGNESTPMPNGMGVDSLTRDLQERLMVDTQRTTERRTHDAPSSVSARQALFPTRPSLVSALYRPIPVRNGNATTSRGSSPEASVESATQRRPLEGGDAMRSAVPRGLEIQNPTALPQDLRGLLRTLHEVLALFPRVSLRAEHSDATERQGTTTALDLRVSEFERHCQEGRWQTIERQLEELQRRSRSTTPCRLERMPPYVWKWMDYSHKYGLGYQLTDGSFGAFFNDGVLLARKEDQLEVRRCRTQREKQQAEEELDIEEHETFRQDGVPEKWAKKVAIMEHFREYMKQHLVRNHTREMAMLLAASSNAERVSFVTRWMRTKHAIVFRVQESVLQVNFFDHSKLILSQNGHHVIYMDEQRGKHVYALHDVVLRRDAGVLARLNFARDILLQWQVDS